LECNFDDITSTSGEGCWGYRQPERHHAYAAKEGRKRRADHGNARDGHKFSIVLFAIYSI